MLAVLASADGLAWVSIFVKALTYAATLVAAGSALVLVGLRTLDDGAQRHLRRLGLGAAIVAALCSAVRIPIRASFLTGGTWDGATDPMLLGMVTESPLGASITVRLVGLGLILALLIPHRIGVWIATAGAVLVSASFALRGHALEEPRLLLGTMITLHILALAFWVGAFAPLYRATRLADSAKAGAIAHEFGEKALWAVGALVVAGALTLAILAGGAASALFSPYGQFFALKLAIFVAVLGLAGLNKLQLTPALQRGSTDAGARLRSSIRIETGLIAAILLATAGLTTLTSPPRNQTDTQSALQDNSVHAHWENTLS